jgi:flagellar hook-length control protein FliK
MQAVSISNVMPTNAPVPGATSLLSPAPQPSSLFAALFQTKLKAGNDAGNLPAAGRPKDSARAQDVTTATSNFPQVALQLLGLVACSPVPVAQAPANPVKGTAVDSAPSQDPIVAAASIQLPASPNPVADTGQHTAKPQDPLVTATSTQPQTFSIPSVDVAQDNTKPQGPAVMVASTQPQTLSIPSVDAARDNIKSQDLSVAAANSPSVPPALPVRTDVAPIVVVPRQALNTATFDANPGAKTADAAPNHDAPSHLSPAETPQVQDAANGPQSDRKTAAPNTAAPNNIAPNNAAQNTAALPNIQALQAAKAGLDFVSLQTSEAAQVPANPSGQTPQSSTTDTVSQFSSKLQTSTIAVASATPLQTVTKSMAIGVSTPTLRESLQSQAANAIQPGPDGAASMRLQSKDTSNGSQGNDANTKPDHASNSAVSHTDGKGFGQTLETAGANTGSAHTASADSTVIAAAMREPVEPRAASAGAKPGANNGAAFLQGPPMPAAAGANQPTVSSARLMDRPGQTEIRIEMQADSLGGVELRAHISGNQIGASIAVEHRDAQVMLTNELPALHNALVEKNLRVDSLSVSQGMPSSMGGGPGSDGGQRGFSQTHPKAVYTTQEEASLPVSDAPAEYTGGSKANARLSVLA